MLFLFLLEGGKLLSALCHSWDMLWAFNSFLDHSGKCQGLRNSHFVFSWFVLVLCALSLPDLKRLIYTLCFHILCSRPLLICCHLVSAPCHLTQIDLANVPGEFPLANTRYAHFSVVSHFTSMHSHCWPLFVTFSVLAAGTLPSLLFFYFFGCPYLRLPCRYVFSFILGVP